METPPPATKQACADLNAQGKPCAAGVRRGARYCFQHDPEQADAAKATRRADGKARNKPAPAPPMDLSTFDAQRRALEEAIGRVRNGDEPLNVARLVVYAVSVALPIVELGDLEERLAALEERLNNEM